MSVLRMPVGWLRGLDMRMLHDYNQYWDRPCFLDGCRITIDFVSQRELENVIAQGSSPLHSKEKIRGFCLLERFGRG